MRYDPMAYWHAAGTDPSSIEHESRFRRTPAFDRQEARLMAVLEGLEFASILEVGCGWGRITELVAIEWPDVPYRAIDLSAERIASAWRKAPDVMFMQSSIQEFESSNTYDLVLAVEVLMHVQPAEIEAVIRKLLGLSSRYVVSLDWSVPITDRKIAPWNFLHDYSCLYGQNLQSVEQTDLQAIYVANTQRSEP